jgi:zinc protease
VQAAAQTWLKPERLKVVAVGDRAAIVPQLQKLGLGEPEVRDVDGQVP